MNGIDLTLAVLVGAIIGYISGIAHVRRMTKPTPMYETWKRYRRARDTRP